MISGNFIGSSYTFSFIEGRDWEDCHEVSNAWSVVMSGVFSISQNSPPDTEGYSVWLTFLLKHVYYLKFEYLQKQRTNIM